MSAGVTKRAIDGRIGEATRAQTETPLRAGVILRLHRTKPRHDVRRPPNRRRRKLLICNPNCQHAGFEL